MEKKSSNLKKIVFGIIILVALFIIICCLSVDDSEKSINKRLKGYCEAIKEFDLGKTEQYMVAEYDYWVDMNENVLNTFMDVFKDSASKIEYTIEDIKVDEDKEYFLWANATVRFRFLDYSKVMSDSLERFEHEIYSMPSDASDEEISRRLHEIFIEEQKAADEAWEDIAIDFLLLKNRKKSNPKWLITSPPEDISIILTCNTESSFEKYGEVSNESNMDESAVTEQETETEEEYVNGVEEYGDTPDLASYLGILYSVDNGDDIVELYINDTGNLCVSSGYYEDPEYSQTYDTYTIEDDVLYGYVGDVVDEFMFGEDGLVLVLLSSTGSGHYQSYIREHEYWETDWRKELGFE